jgi:hypothetical protein
MKPNRTTLKSIIRFSSANIRNTFNVFAIYMHAIDTTWSLVHFGVKCVRIVNDAVSYFNFWLMCLELLTRFELNIYMEKKSNNFVSLMYFGVSRKIDVYQHDKSKRTSKWQTNPIWRPPAYIYISRPTSPWWRRLLPMTLVTPHTPGPTLQSTTLLISITITQALDLRKGYIESEALPLNSIINFPFLDSNIATRLAYDFYLLMLDRYSRPCTWYPPWTNDYTDYCKDYCPSVICSMGFVRHLHPIERHTLTWSGNTIY